MNHAELHAQNAARLRRAVADARGRRARGDNDTAILDDLLTKAAEAEADWCRASTARSVACLKAMQAAAAANRTAVDAHRHNGP